MSDNRQKSRIKMLVPLSRIKGASDIDTVKHGEKIKEKRSLQILYEANSCWDNMRTFREERDRCKRYTYGRQWSDLVDVDGERMTEEEYIKRQGNVPLKNNLIRRLVRNVLGVFRSQQKEPTCTARDRDEQQLGETMSTILQCNMQLNRMGELNARTMEEFLIGGLIVHRKSFGWRNDKLDCWTDYVNPNNFFIDSNVQDFRGWDVSMVGEIHDVSFDDICTNFAASPRDYEKLKAIYAHCGNRDYVIQNWVNFGQKDNLNMSFLLPTDPNLCRVIEVWRKERKPRYRCHDYLNGDVFKIDLADKAVMVDAVNDERVRQGTSEGMAPNEIPLIQAEWFIDSYWCYYYLSPTGDILDSGETPYEHKSHPYVFKAYPFIDGEIHSFVSDVIDQQRYVNRLITMQDWIMRASAKGVLLFPEECMPENMTAEDIAEEWSRYNGVMFIKTKNNTVMPQQISGNSTNIGIGELLNLQLKFFEDISGVNGALQGKPGYSGMSGSLYQQQTQNATTSLLDMLDGYSMFVVDSAYKDVKNMQQFYDTKRVYNIAGKSGEMVVYDPQKIRDVEFDLSIVESQSTPAYRQMANEFLLQIWQTGQITLQQLLEHGDFPFADSLLQSIQSQQEAIANGEAPQGIDPQLLQQAQAGVDMDAVNQAYGAMHGG